MKLSPRKTPLIRSAQVALRLLSAALVLVTFGCSQVPQKPPESSLKQAKNAPSAAEYEEYERHHVAPPPAYGNKIVLATDDGSDVSSL